MIGRYPTPVQRLGGLSTSSTELWVKRDDLTSEVYGGNKVRKLDRILERAAARKARRLVTFGTAGSHQALATAIHGSRAGFETAAILAPQPKSDYAVDNLRAAVGHGLQAFPARNFGLVPVALARMLRRHDFIIEPGGSSVEGTIGYIEAARELIDQVKSGALPAPDAIVVPLGSGGTAAGLLAGLVALGSATKIVAVRIVGAALMGEWRALFLAARAARSAGYRVSASALRASFEMDRGYLGRGYAYPTSDGARATEAAASEGVTLDATYTGKAFAAALDIVRAGRFSKVLYWHTLSSVRPDVVEKPELPAHLASLFEEVSP